MDSFTEKHLDQEQSEASESLMRRFQNGEEEAFQLLFKRHASHLLNFANRFLNSKTDSEEIAQEVLLRIYKNRERYDCARPFRPWVFSIAARLVSNKLRERRRHPQISMDAPINHEGETALGKVLPDNNSLSLEEGLERQELIKAVGQALEALPENQRMAVLLSRFEAMSYEEIAETLKLSIASVKSLLFRARQTLKEKLSLYVSREKRKVVK